MPSGGAPEGFGVSEAVINELMTASPDALLLIGRSRAKADVRLAHGVALRLYERINFTGGSEWICDRLGGAWPRVLGELMKTHLPDIDPVVAAIQRMAAAGMRPGPPQVPTDYAFRLARMCCLALHRFTCCDEDEVSATSHLRRQRVAESGALAAVVKAMTVYKLAQWRVGQAACMVLYNVCAGGNHAIREAVANAGAIEATAEFLTYHSRCSECARNRAHVCAIAAEDWAKNADFGLRVLINLCGIRHEKTIETATEFESIVATGERSRRAKRACLEEDIFDKIRAAYNGKNASIMSLLQSAQKVIDLGIITGKRARAQGRISPSVLNRT